MALPDVQHRAARGGAAAGGWIGSSIGIAALGTAVAGTLGVTGATTLSSTLGVTAATTLSSTAAVTGAITGSDGATLAKEDSGTNTVLTPLTVKRTSSATPAIGIGTGMDFVTETGAGNNEIGAAIQSITTDVTSTNEDFDLLFKLMAGGSAAAERLRIKSTGKVAFANSAYASVQVSGSATGATTLDFDTYQNFVLTLTGNVTLANPTTEAVGQSGFIVFIQDGTGSRTVSLGTDYETASGAGLTLSTIASTTDLVPYIVAASGRILLGAPQFAFS